MGKTTENPTTPDHVYYIIGAYMTIAFILSLFCNLFVTYIFCRIFKKKPNIVNLIVINLGIANTLQTCPSFLWVIINGFMKKYVLGRDICLLDSVWVTWCAITVITLLAYLAFERYQMIKEMRTTETRVNAKRLLSVGGCWVYALFWSVMPLFGWSSYGMEGIGISCSVEWHLRTRSGVSFIICLFVAAYVLPLSVICFMYFRTWSKIKQSAIRVRPQGETGNNTGGTHKKVAVMGALMAGSFLLTWTPYAIVSFIEFIRPDVITPIQASVPAIFAKSSPVYLPIICATKHVGFKTECQRLLGRIAARAGAIAPSTSEWSKTGITQSTIGRSQSTSHH